ncbi:MFS transporter [Shimazuella sp. AN120528]|uniref:MFS transporter n=1 Tax=Shimazuella soli TaxID=1892854 RepID=UPI001F11282F|nr:MFS transporter [Shimazuella soli]MCH5585750.1 MFS transporter [Shimazuella soli]
MQTISSKTAFWIVAWVISISLWSSAAPSIVFPVYASFWHLSKAVTTGIYATYPVVLVLVLVLFGNISDYIGRRNTLLIGLSFLFIGALIFALAPSMIWLFIGRVFQGIGVGLTSGSGAAALVDFNPTSNQKLPGSINTIAQSVGLFMSTIIGASLIKFAPFPLYLSYWFLVGFIIITAVLSSFLPRQNVLYAKSHTSWKPQGLKVPRALLAVYIVAALAVGTGFAEGGIFLSLGAQIARDVVGTNDILTIGIVLSISYLIASISALLASRLTPITSILVGALAVIVTVGLLVVSSYSHSFVAFVLSDIIGGIAYGFAAAGGIGLASQYAPIQDRAKLLSSVFLFSYLLQGASAYCGGLATTLIGFERAVFLLSVIIALLTLLVLFLALLVRRKVGKVASE